MLSGSSFPSLAEAGAEQRRIQADAVTFRSLAEYNERLFAHPHIADFVVAEASGADSVETLIEAMASEDDGHPLHWVDMAGGYAIPMRQIAELRRLAGPSMTSVDLVEWDIDTLVEDRELKERAAGFDIRNSRFAPARITDFVETVTLPERANLITSVMAIQYFRDPLLAITNWYNQLHPDGLMLVTGIGTHWSTSVLQRDRYSALIESFEDAMESAGIAYAIDDDTDYGVVDKDASAGKAKPVIRWLPARTCFDTIAIKKKPGTHMKLHAQVEEIIKEPYPDPSNDLELNTVFYTGEEKPIEVVAANS